MKDDGLRAAELSCSEVGIGDTSEDADQEMLKMLSKGREWLVRWAARSEKQFPSYEHDVPPEENLTIKNILHSVGNTNTCNQECKTC